MPLYTSIRPKALDDATNVADALLLLNRLRIFYIAGDDEREMVHGGMPIARDELHAAMALVDADIADLYVGDAGTVAYLRGGRR